ncbi:helix-turn-helix transcriptional regulator [Arcticibacterium luteifluviistationis]|uniref:Transcriptional regulator n=1 Tax=Arcticibacterium luteifluviistationis TaxID=1784714 RepID=A0A2Z4G938_9BACT|nr:YafY family protein [Arcticibacterium luteifluviistationis]AWV97732.1 transcriptional regulator [Arcticibacterium luteifluviistationis]
MPRLNRLTEILIQLQSKRIIKAQEIADRFDISLRTVYRDIRALEVAGVPILSEAGVGYSIMKEYRLPPVQFTEDEAFSFLTAGKLVSKFTDNDTQKSFESALFKIKSVLKNVDKELLDDAYQHIEVLENNYLPSERNEQLNIKEILKAILNKNIIKIEYFTGSRFEKNERDIEPIGIFSSNDNWYLIAWCRLREDYRNFRIDKITALAVQTERFDKKHPKLKTFISKTQSKENLTKVVLRIDKTGFRYMGDQYYYMGFISQKDLGDQIEMSFLTGNLMGFAHWFLYLGKVADIIEPEQLKIDVKQLLLKGIERLQ